MKADVVGGDCGAPFRLEQVICEPVGYQNKNFSN